MLIAKRLAVGFGIAVALPVLINLGVSSYSKAAVSSDDQPQQYDRSQPARESAETLYGKCQAACWLSATP